MKELQKSVEEIESVVDNWKQKGQLQKDTECLKELRSNLCAKEGDLSELKDKLASISKESTAVDHQLIQLKSSSTQQEMQRILDLINHKTDLESKQKILVELRRQLASYSETK